jgi:hypothetical protein
VHPRFEPVGEEDRLDRRDAQGDDVRAPDRFARVIDGDDLDPVALIPMVSLSGRARWAVPTPAPAATR